jgi:hypothetical protein
MLKDRRLSYDFADTDIPIPERILTYFRATHITTKDKQPDIR